MARILVWSITFELTVVFAAVFPTAQKIRYEETDGKGMMHIIWKYVTNLTSVYWAFTDLFYKGFHVSLVKLAVA